MKKAIYFFNLMTAQERKNFTAEFENDDNNQLFADMANISLKEEQENFLNEFFGSFGKFLEMAFDQKNTLMGSPYWVVVENKYKHK